MNGFVIRLAVGMLGLWVAQAIVPGMTISGLGTLLLAAFLLGLVNALVRPLLKLLTCPLIFLTLGLFTLVINALTLWLSASIAQEWFHVGFHIDRFGSALLGALIVSIVTVILSAVLKDESH